MTYPTTIDVYITLVDNVDYVYAADHNDRATAIIAIENALGTFLSSSKIVGEVKAWGGTIATIPAGWLHCNGAAISRTAYASLFTVIDTQYGSGDGSTTFNLPETRDLFIVGAKQDSGGAAKTNLTGSLLKSGGSASQPPLTASTGGNEATNSGSQGTVFAHTHSFVPPYTAIVYMIRT